MDPTAIFSILNQGVSAYGYASATREEFSNIRASLPVGLNRVIDRVTDPIRDLAGQAVEYAIGDIVKDKVAQRMLYKLAASITYKEADTDRLSDLLYFFYGLYDDAPARTGLEIKDGPAWEAFVMKKLRDYENEWPGEIEPPISPELIRNLEAFTGRDFSFLYSKDEFAQYLFGMPYMEGMMQYFLSIPLGRMAGHYSMIYDRFGKGLLPMWVDELGVKPGLSFIGDVERSKIFNTEEMRILGFALVDAPEPTPMTGKHPFSVFKNQPEGTDKFGNNYKYNYFGPNNPLPNGEPINTIDRLARDHDYSYGEGGYFNEEADRVFVDSIQKAIADGVITEESPYDEFALAQKAINYFSSVEHK